MIFKRREIFLIPFLLIGCFLVCSRQVKAETIVLSPLGSGSFNELSLGDGEVRTFSFAPASVSADSIINSITLNATARSASGSSSFQLKLEKISDQSTITGDMVQNLTDSYASYSWEMTTNSFTESAWTVSEVNNWDVNFGVINHGTEIIYINQISLVVDYSPPLIAFMRNPLKGATSVSLDIKPTIIFSRPLDPATVKGTVIELKKFGPPASDVEFSISLDPTGKIVTITPNQPLEPSTVYYLTITKDKVKDLEGNFVPSWTKGDSKKPDKDCQYFITTDGSIPLGITRISSTRSLAQADNDWNHGWQWVFNITIPLEETNISMKFDDWVETHGASLSADNTRIYSPQSSEHSTAETSVLISETDSYTQPMVLTGDIEPAVTGRQIQVVVEVKIPVGSVVGSYSTNYSILTN